MSDTPKTNTAATGDTTSTSDWVDPAIKPVLDLIASGKSVPFHPLADKFPLIGSEELKELAEDIRKNGMLERITLHEDKILDGRNRYLAAEMVGLTLKAESFRRLPYNVDPWDFVVSENIQRRHLTQEQKRYVIESLLKADPKKSDRAIAAIAKVDNKTVGGVRTVLETGEEIPHQTKRVGKDRKKQSGTKKTTRKKTEQAHVIYKAKQEELIDLLKETHTSYSQAVEWADNTKQRLDETLASIAEELDSENEKAA
jgi:hypothetical protein